jgi:NADH-quinone oxidoreductase subunit N
MATGVKVAVFGLAIRIFMSLNALSLEETFDMAGVQSFLTIAIAATFIVGNLVAIVQEDVKRMLAYSSISHAGFLLFGILAGFKDSAYDVVHADVVFFYLFGYLFMTLGAFAVLSLMLQEKNEATNFGDLRGLGYKHPLLAGVFGLFMLAMMGLPGTAGFAAKYGIVALAVQNGHIPMAVLAVTISVISAFYYLRPIAVMFFKDDAARSVIKEMPLTLCITITTCVVAVLYLGFMPDKYLKLSCLATSVFHKSLPPTCLPEF